MIVSSAQTYYQPPIVGADASTWLSRRDSSLVEDTHERS